jgi:hypothetical protein
MLRTLKIGTAPNMASCIFGVRLRNVSPKTDTQ